MEQLPPLSFMQTITLFVLQYANTMSSSSMHSNCRIRLDYFGTNARILNGNASIHLRISSFHREIYQFRMYKFKTKMIKKQFVQMRGSGNLFLFPRIRQRARARLMCSVRGNCACGETNAVVQSKRRKLFAQRNRF